MPTLPIDRHDIDPHSSFFFAAPNYTPIETQPNVITIYPPSTLIPQHIEAYSSISKIEMHSTLQHIRPSLSTSHTTSTTEPSPIPSTASPSSPRVHLPLGICRPPIKLLDYHCYNAHVSPSSFQVKKGTHYPLFIISLIQIFLLLIMFF